MTLRELRDWVEGLEYVADHDSGCVSCSVERDEAHEPGCRWVQAMTLLDAVMVQPQMTEAWLGIPFVGLAEGVDVPLRDLRRWIETLTSIGQKLGIPLDSDLLTTSIRPEPGPEPGPGPGPGPGVSSADCTPLAPASARHAMEDVAGWPSI